MARALPADVVSEMPSPYELSHHRVEAPKLLLYSEPVGSSRSVLWTLARAVPNSDIQIASSRFAELRESKLKAVSLKAAPAV